MSKSNLIIANLLMLVILFWLNSSHLSAQCRDCPQRFPSTPNEVQYKESWIFKWSADNPQNIARGGAVTVKIEGGYANYQWQVSGNGYSLTENETTGVTNVLNADASACGEATITVTDYQKNQVQGTLSPLDPSFVWDEASSPIQFPSKYGSADVYVTGGQGPYSWQVNDGFTLGCTNDCGASNTVTSQGTGCVAEITVTDSCGSQATGEVRRPDGYWGPDFNGCYRYKLSTCYNNWCNSIEPTEVEFVGHKVQFSCCGYRGQPEVTGKCKVDGVPDGFEFTANIADCNLYSFCLDDPNYDPGIFSLYIYKWTCF